MPTECSDTVSAVSPLNLPQQAYKLHLYLGDYAANFQIKHSSTSLLKGDKTEKAAISLNLSHLKKNQ